MKAVNNVDDKSNVNIKASRKSTRTLLKAEFDPRIKKYVLYLGVLILFVTVAGILLIPFWLIFGNLYINRYFRNLHCELTTRALHFKKGVLFHTERTIPLDKIQDLTFKEGPLLRYFGLSILAVETAGQSSQSASDLSLLGIIDANRFRAKVLDQRDIVTDNIISSDDKSDSGSLNELTGILKEIRDSLYSINEKLDR
jgi:membrane protein YdbS with pleckstrin-like domain